MGALDKHGGEGRAIKVPGMGAVGLGAGATATGAGIDAGRVGAGLDFWTGTGRGGDSLRPEVEELECRYQVLDGEDDDK